MRYPSRLIVTLLTVASVALAGCGHRIAGPAAAGAGSTAVGGTAAAGPVASRSAGAEPSSSARMICAPEARDDILANLGVTLRQDPVPVWSAPTFICTYNTSGGVLTLSVRELSSAKQTIAFFESARSAGVSPQPLNVLGDAAFATADGSVYVRKDFKVLRVDMTRMAAYFGRPPLSRAAAGIRVAQVIMGCWTGD